MIYRSSQSGYYTCDRDMIILPCIKEAQEIKIAVSVAKVNKLQYSQNIMNTRCIFGFIHLWNEGID